MRERCQSSPDAIVGPTKEVALRAALGASRWRVVRQLLTEAVLLSLAGGLVGLLIAYWGVPALVATLPQNQLNALPFLKSLQIDFGILGFSFGLSLLTGSSSVSFPRSSLRVSI